jgi:hypothetical protein
MDYKLSEESATAEFNRFMEYYEIDVSGASEGAPDDFVEMIEPAVNRIIKAIRLGRLEIGDDGCTLVQTLRNPPGEATTITYGEVSGKAKVAMKGKDINDHFGRMYSMLGSMSGLGESAIMGLKSVDLSLAESLGVLFLVV